MGCKRLHLSVRHRGSVGLRSDGHDSACGPKTHGHLTSSSTTQRKSLARSACSDIGDSNQGRTKKARWDGRTDSQPRGRSEVGRNEASSFEETDRLSCPLPVPAAVDARRNPHEARHSHQRAANHRRNCAGHCVIQCRSDLENQAPNRATFSYHSRKTGKLRSPTPPQLAAYASVHVAFRGASTIKRIPTTNRGSAALSKSTRGISLRNACTAMRAP